MHSTKKESQILQGFQNGRKFLPWLLAARPKTWIAAIAPVALGASLSQPLNWPLLLCTFGFAMLIQIGTNFANDYYDFFHGADDASRVGPARAVASGWIKPDAMKMGFVLCFAAAVLISLPLVATCGIIALPVVASSVLFGILYTAGAKPLGYMGLGELFVFFYFGPLPVLGTYYVQKLTVFPMLFWWGVVPGLLSCAVLIANNLRDREGDVKAGKRTLVVRWGHRFGVVEYGTALIAAVAIAAYLKRAELLFALGAAAPLIRQAYARTNLPSLLPKTALFFILFMVLFVM